MRHKQVCLLASIGGDRPGSQGIRVHKATNRMDAGASMRLCVHVALTWTHNRMDDLTSL
jgi:hypothetical protein